MRHYQITQYLSKWFSELFTNKLFEFIYIFLCCRNLCGQFHEGYRCGTSHPIQFERVRAVKGGGRHLMSSIQDSKNGCVAYCVSICCKAFVWNSDEKSCITYSTLLPDEVPLLNNATFVYRVGNIWDTLALLCNLEELQMLEVSLSARVCASATHW